jgi:DNA repair protein RadC
MMNLTNTDTIYKKRFRTISLKVDEPFRDRTHTASPPVDSPDDLYHKVLRSIFDSLDDDQEHFVVLFLNASGRVTGFKVLFSGTQSSANVDCKLIYRNAILFGAHSIIVAHNHPSGNLLPSREDRDITRQIIAVGDVHQIPLRDHIIVTNDGFTSLASEDPWLFD